jgi:hypothetical protein
VNRREGYIRPVTNITVFKKQLYELVCKEQSSSEFLRGVPGVTVKESVLRIEFAEQDLGERVREDIAVGSQCGLKTLRVRQCVIICESDR